jgi:hypothetical protein
MNWRSELLLALHDMRRTARTQMAALGIDRFVAERALNHKARDVEGICNQYDYFEERRVALSRWAALLSGVCALEGCHSVDFENGMKARTWSCRMKPVCGRVGTEGVADA